MWLKFTDSFTWKPRPSVTQIYKPGQVFNVPSRCADKALAAGKAVRTVNPRMKKKSDGETSECR